MKNKGLEKNEKNPINPVILFGKDVMGSVKEWQHLMGVIS